MVKRKYTYENIESYFLSVDYVLLTSRAEYVNVGTCLKVQCPAGHTYTTNWSNFYHKGNRCKKCLSMSMEDVKSAFCSCGYKVLSNSYENQYTKIKYKCKYGHKNVTTWNNWQNGCGCPECVKTPYEEIVKLFEKEGYKLLSKKEEYKKHKFKFKFVCPNGHISSMNWFNFKYGFRCGLCAPNKKKTFREVKESFSERGYMLISTVYVNEDTKLEYVCDKGHSHSITWSNFNKGQGCAKCGLSISKVSQQWLNSLGISEHLREYRLSGLGGPIGFLVDGFDPETNTVYEFLGDYWHGNPEVYSADKINTINKKLFCELYKEWLNRKNILEKAGYNVVYIWESDYCL